MAKTWKVVLAFAGIFLTGGVTGALLALRLTAPPSPAPAPAVAETPATAPAPLVAATNLPAAVPPQPAPARPNAPLAAAPEQIGPQLFRRLTNQLNLTQEQRQKIRPIELRATEELNRLRRDAVHNTQVLIDKNEDEIRAVLTTEQAAKFDELVGLQRQRIQKFVLEQQKRQRELREKMLQGKNGNVMATPANATVTPVGAGEPKK